MVRILKVDGLQERKKELRARSEIYRQTLVLEVTNVRMSVALLKKRFSGIKSVYRMFGWAVPVGGLLFGAKREAEGHGKSGFLTQLLSGLNLAGKIKSIFQKFKGAGHAEEEEPEGSPRL
jgi:hypothetical protein